MRRVRDRFSTILRTEAGHQFHGEFGDPNSYPRPRKEIQNLPHRALVTAKAAVVSAGDLVISSGTRYLLCGQHTLSETKRFLAVEVNQSMRWTRLGEVTDPVTKMKKDDAEILMDASLWVALEPQRAFDEVKFSQSQSRIFTSSDVQPGDKLDAWKVLRISELFGLRVAEIA